MSKYFEKLKDNSKVIFLLLILGCFLFIFSAINKINLLNNDLIQRPKDNEVINNYLKSDESNLIKNTSALESFEKVNDSEMKYYYDTNKGTVLKSDSSNWNEDKLKLLYEELLKNEHGKEIETLREIIVHKDLDENASGSHQVFKKTYEFKFNFPAIPKVYPIEILGDFGEINLYNGDEDKTIESQAFVLSHEYGHHYTYHYMFVDGKVAKDGEYAKKRKLDTNENVKSFDDNEDYDQYLDNHHWYLQEIAADDYVQLMGSKNARRIVDYQDSKDSVNSSNHEWEYHSLNGTPQENFLIPLAFEVDGLYDYYYSFIKSSRTKPAIHKNSAIDIKVTPRSVGFDLVEGYRTFKYYDITWNKPYKEDGVVYTLISYDTDTDYDYPLPLKTVYSKEKAQAIVGEYAKESSGYILWSSSRDYLGTKYLVVSATFKDGSVLKSDPLKYTFE